MANPFGSADQTLVKNTSHPNQLNLIRALVPRSTTKWVEVISASTPTVPATGTYDADGYFFGANGTNAAIEYTLPANLSSAGTLTIIVGLRYNSGGANSGGGQTLGLVASTTGDFRFYADRYSRRINASHYDSTAVSSGINFAWVQPSGNDFSGAVATTPGSQKAFCRVGATTTNTDPATSSSSLGGTASLNILRVDVATLYGIQYLFVYNDYLLTGDIETIMDAPGEVLSQAAGPLPKMGRCIYHLP
jgi:hypothetical protein